MTQLLGSFRGHAVSTWNVGTPPARLGAFGAPPWAEILKPRATAATIASGAEPASPFQTVLVVEQQLRIARRAASEFSILETCMASLVLALCLDSATLPG
jgi:hypothetical protein